MKSLTSESWFWWAVGLAAGLPAALVVLTELHGWLSRRGSALAPVVANVRNFALPAGALLMLLTNAWDISDEETWVRIIATVFGFLVLVLALSTLNIALFSNAESGTWRARMPGIFVDIARLLLIVAGLAVLFTWVWGADVGGLFAALGVTSIVLGFALQNAVGSIISGLLLLFEQPFRLGDWLDAGAVRGRVVEVNWRSVHIETGEGIQIVPNATLAGAEFTNLSRPAGSHDVSIVSTFAVSDRPEVVRAVLEGVAADLPALHPDFSPHTDLTGPSTYTTTVTVRSPADADLVAATFRRWAWYASRRNGLHLDGGADDATAESISEALSEAAPVLSLTDDDVTQLAAQARRERWAAGERLQREGLVPDGLRCVLAGRVSLQITTAAGVVEVGEVGLHDTLGETTVTREPALAGAVALDEVTTLLLPQDALDELVAKRTQLARHVGRAIDLRRNQVSAAAGTVATIRRLAV